MGRLGTALVYSKLLGTDPHFAYMNHDNITEQLTKIAPDFMQRRSSDLADVRSSYTKTIRSTSHSAAPDVRPFPDQTRLQMNADQICPWFGRRAAWAAVVAAAGVALAGCGGGGQQASTATAAGGGQTGTSLAAATTADPAGATTATATASAARPAASVSSSASAASTAPASSVPVGSVNPLQPRLANVAASSGPLTVVIDEPGGLFAEQNELIMQGAIAAVDVLNAKGGVAHNKVRLVPEHLDGLSASAVQQRLHAAGANAVLVLPCDSNSQATLANGAAAYGTLHARSV